MNVKACFEYGTIDTLFLTTWENIAHFSVCAILHFSNINANSRIASNSHITKRCKLHIKDVFHMFEHTNEEWENKFQSIKQWAKRFLGKLIKIHALQSRKNDKMLVKLDLWKKVFLKWKTNKGTIFEWKQKVFRNVHKKIHSSPIFP